MAGLGDGDDGESGGVGDDRSAGRLAAGGGLVIGTPATPGARLGLALRERRPAMALSILDGLKSQISDEMQISIAITIWYQAGSVRGVREWARGQGGDSVADETSESSGDVFELAKILDEVMPPLASIDAVLQAAAFGEEDIPRAAPEVLVLMRDAAANAGRAADLVRIHLALAEHADRVDQRVGLVEAAESLVQVLEDRRLGALVQAFLARVDADFGEDDDAAERVAVVLRDVTETEAPRAVAIAMAVKAVLATRKDDAGEAAACRVAAARLFSCVGWGDDVAAYPGPAWGLVAD